MNAALRHAPLSPTADRAAIERAAELVAGADSLVIAVGAGMGVDSGLPDFRGNAGFWRAYPTLAAEGTAFMDIASPAAFRANARRAWGFYGHRLGLYRKAVPHDGYALLRKWGEAMRHGYFVCTSNVDGHFHRAGFDPLRIDEFHGDPPVFQRASRGSAVAPLPPDVVRFRQAAAHAGAQS